MDMHLWSCCDHFSGKGRDHTIYTKEHIWFQSYLENKNCSCLSESYQIQTAKSGTTPLLFNIYGVPTLETLARTVAWLLMPGSVLCSTWRVLSLEIVTHIVNRPKRESNSTRDTDYFPVPDCGRGSSCGYSFQVQQAQKAINGQVIWATEHYGTAFWWLSTNTWYFQFSRSHCWQRLDYFLNR